MAEAVGQQDDLERDEDVPPDLRDVIAVSILMASLASDPAALELTLHGIPAVRRLGLSEMKMTAILAESAAEVQALTEALGN